MLGSEDLLLWGYSTGINSKVLFPSSVSLCTLKLFWAGFAKLFHKYIHLIWHYKKYFIINSDENFKWFFNLKCFRQNKVQTS